MLRNADGVGGGCQIFRKKRYECVRFNVISVMRGGWGSNSQKKKRYVTLEWPLTTWNRKSRVKFSIATM